MRRFSFTWSGSAPHDLAQRLSRPIDRASVNIDEHGKPYAVTLWHSDGTGLRIRSRMCDIAERCEVGVLDFSIVTSAVKDEKTVSFPAAFYSGTKASKLVVSESGVNAESGLILESSDGQEIVIVAGVFPYSLAISCLSSTPHGFEPEYPLETYTRVEIA